MEEELAASRVQVESMENMLKSIMKKLEILDKENECTENLGPKKSASSGRVDIKPANPSEFNGDHEKGRAFLNSCNIYFMICGDLFPNEQARIHWALSFFKSDRVARFSNMVLCSGAKWKCPHFNDWSAFSKTFIDLFCPKNKQLMVLTKLEGTSWYQAKDSVDEYIDQFQELIDVVEYVDDKTIVIKFCKGLDLTVQNKVTMIGDNTPDFDDLE
jgi:hypothetical protein